MRGNESPVSAGARIVPSSFSKAIGCYSPGVRVPITGDLALLFISGQVATDADGRTVGVDDPEAQTRKVFANLTTVLDAAGGSLADLVSVTIYVTDMAHFAPISGVRNEILRELAPSSTFVEVKGLAVPDHLVEISGVAVIRSDAARSGAQAKASNR